MSPDITLDLASAVPPFEQLRARVAELVDDGTLTPGSRLPSVRALAADLGIAVGTVARAYRELEAAGYVLSRRRHGTTVAEHPPRGQREVPAGVGPVVTELVEDLVAELVRQADAAGLSRHDLVDLVSRRATRLDG